MGICAALTAGSELALAQDTAILEEVTVTGSRLRRDGMSTPTPVTSVGRDEIRSMAPTLLMDALSQMPQFRDNDQSQTGSIFSESGGANSVNLRGIGSSRTLTLLNGRRIVPGQQAGTVDISILPTALIERVEVVTGGASAAYGSDAISGVTNFILDTDFEGVKGNVQSGQTSRGDHDNYQVEFAFGAPIGENGHFIGSVDYYDAEGILGYHGREWGQQGWAMLQGGGIPRYYAPNVRARNTTTGGIIPFGSASGSLGGTMFIDGAPTPYQVSPTVVGSAQIGGNIPDVSDDYSALRPNDNRSSLFAMYTHDFGSDKSGFIQFLKGRHTNESMPGVTTFRPGWSTYLYADNPYLPESIAATMAAEGLARVPFNRTWDQLSPSRLVEDTTTSITMGFEGEIGDDLYMTAYWQHGENIEYADYSSNGQLVRTDRYYRALDSAIDPATGQISCRANIPSINPLTPEEEGMISKLNNNFRQVFADPESARGCIPLDPFATELPQSVVDYVTGAGIYHRQTLNQDVFDLTLQTNIGEGRGAGPISIGGGVGYRQEDVFQDAFGNPGDPRRIQDFGVFSSFNNPGDLIPIRGIPSFTYDRAVHFTGNPNSQGVLQGEYDVWEVFGETIVPLSSGIDLHLASRYADYEGSGGVWAAKAGLDWQITDTLRFRGTWSRDTRAGTLSERFDTQGAGTTISPGDDPLNPNADYIAGFTTGGNPNIRPEESDTTTFGIVWQPSWADNLSMSVDLYDITITDAIDQLGRDEILDRCYIQGAQDICALIRRNEAGLIQSIFNVFINISETVTRGVDMEASYQRPITLVGGADESIAFRFFANYLDEVSFNFPGTTPLNEAGALDYPEWLMNGSVTYRRGPFRLMLQSTYRDSSIRNPLWVEGIDIVDNSVASRTYVNLNMAYEFEWGNTLGEVYFYVGNLTDEDPPLMPNTIGGDGAAAYTDNGIFDTLGRNYSVGIQFGF